jgi:site-specific recombinase XerD
LPDQYLEKSVIDQLDIPYQITGTHDSENTKLDETVLPGAEHDRTGIWRKVSPATSLPTTGNRDEAIHLPDKIRVLWTGKGFVIDFPYSSKLVSQVKGLEGAWWNQKHKKWLCKNTLGNLKKIQESWQIWDEETYNGWFDKISQSINPCKIKIYYSPKYPGFACVQVIGYGANHEIIKRFSGRKYLQEIKTYLVPGEKSVIEQLATSYADVGYKIENRLSTFVEKKESYPSQIKRLDTYLAKLPNIRFGFFKRYSDTMLRSGYGYKTIVSYLGKIAILLEYYQVNDMAEISADQANKYLELITRRGVSFSLVNLVYSAIKIYHDKVAYTDHFEMRKLSRPKKRFNLPKFLSESEVLRLIDNIENIKHLAILYMLYGSGLRRGELLKIQLKHLYWDRNQILIEDGKGNKDRIVNLSTEMKSIIDIYIQEYQPATFLFESRTPGKAYSASSIGAIVRKAAEKASISKKVTPHVLRHSFATHLMDNGIALPKIQKLLGHNDVKTTMIYTHLTRKSIEEVESPLDALLRKKRNRDTE